MDSKARLTRALGAKVAPERDPLFVLEVMRAAESSRFRAETAQAMLRGAGLAAAAAALAVPFLAWAGPHMAGLQGGLLGVAALFTLVGTARFMTQRVTAVWAR